MAPVERGAQRGLTIRGAPPARQQPEHVVQPLEHLGQRHGGQPGGGQLDGQREAVDAAAHLDRSLQVLLVEGDVGVGGPSPVDQELHPVVLVEGPDPVDPLPLDAERLPGRHQGRDRGAAVEDLVEQCRSRPDQVLAVVDHQECVAVGQAADHPGPGRVRRLGGAGGSLAGHAQCGREGADDATRVGDVSQADEDDPVGVVGSRPARRLDRQAGLAGPADADEADAPCRAEPLGHRRHLAVASDERRPRAGQGVDGLTDQDGELGGEAG